MSKRRQSRADLKPDAVAIFDVMSRAAAKSVSHDLHGVLADCACDVARVYGDPQRAAGPSLELTVEALALPRDPKRQKLVRDVRLCEMGSGDGEGARSVILVHTDCPLILVVRIIELAKLLGASIYTTPLGCLSPDFIHPAWKVPVAPKSQEVSICSLPNPPKTKSRK